MKTPHKHAELMMQYAQDAAETETPWERWEYRNDMGGWSTLRKNPAWHEADDYRRKPQTIRIGDYDVPEPCRESLTEGTRYYMPSIVSSNLTGSSIWYKDSQDQMWLAAGIVHRTQEAAELHAKALLSFTRREGDAP